MSYASGQHRMHNPTPNEDGKYTMTAITDKDDVRDYKAGRMTADDLKDKYMGAITVSKYSPTNADNIVDTLTMPGDYMPEASPTAPLTNRQYKQDTDTDFDAMAETNRDGMTGVSRYKRY